MFEVQGQNASLKSRHFVSVQTWFSEVVEVVNPARGFGGLGGSERRTDPGLGFLS